MASLVEELISGVVKSAVSEILKKSHGKTATRRTRRRARPAKKKGLVEEILEAALSKKPARKQTSRRRTAATRSKQRKR